MDSNDVETVTLTPVNSSPDDQLPIFEDMPTKNSSKAAAQDEKAPPPPPPPPKTDEDMKLISTILSYKKTFKKDCKDIDMKNIEHMTFDQLTMKLNECKQALASKDKNKVHRIAFKGLLTFTEIHVAPMIKMDLKGLAGTACEDDDMMQCLDEIVLLNDWGVQNASPEMRLALGLGMLVIKVNAHNKAAKSRETREFTTPTEECQRSADDL
jgi:hypothetical protein